MSDTKTVVALVGNPNCGKTTLFNELTGSNYDVGNRIGVTVESKKAYAVTTKYAYSRSSGYLFPFTEQCGGNYNARLHYK